MSIEDGYLNIQEWISQYETEEYEEDEYTGNNQRIGSKLAVALKEVGYAD